MRAQSLFIAGTDTGVGKTRVSCALLEKFKQQHQAVLGMKPVASGCQLTDDGLRNEDAEQLIKHSSFTLPYSEINPYAFAEAIAPHIAADRDNVNMELDVIIQHFKSLSAQCDHVIVEGVGGWKVPINKTETMADVAIALDLPVLLVVGMRLGCINHALLTYQAIVEAGLQCVGWVANQIDADMSSLAENITTLEQWLDAPLVARIPYQEHADTCDMTGYFVEI